MLHRLMICVGFLAMAVVALEVLAPAPATALAGCCKQANGDGTWTITKLSIEGCEAKNEADGDNVLEASGNWWWDISC